MATDTLNVAISPGLSLGDGDTVKFEAISPTTGGLVSGVLISAAVIYADITAETQPTADVVPLLTPIQLDDQSTPV